MKRFKKIREKITLHPMMAFVLLASFVIVLSGILDVFDASITYNRINEKTGVYETTLVTVESLLNLSGIKYIFSNTVSNFISFTPLSMLLIVLIGIGIMDKSGFLDTIFFILTKNISKKVVTFVYSLICIFASISGNLSFVVLIPLAALLYKYGKRNPEVGIIMAFASLSLGVGINFMVSSVDSSLLSATELAAKIITPNYMISSFAYLFIMLVASIIAAALITYITEKITVPKLGKYIDEEEIIIDKDKLTKKEKRGLSYAGIGALIYLVIFLYNIIPNIPLGGNLLDYSQSRYIDMLFGAESFFNNGFVFVVTILFIILGLLYGIGSKSINNHRDICNYLAHSLDGIGKIILIIFFASMFISLFKYTNIGSLIMAGLTNIINGLNISGVPLIILMLIISMFSTLFLPNMVMRWNIFSGTIVPRMMTSGFTPEFAQMLFAVGSSLTYGLTPVMAYFVIYVSFMEKYDKDGVSLIKCIKYILPYNLMMILIWVCLILLWYFVGIPLGINSSVIL